MLTFHLFVYKDALSKIIAVNEVVTGYMKIQLVCYFFMYMHYSNI
jgi:hypothetical protein